MKIPSLLHRLAIVILALALATGTIAADANPFFAMDTALRDGKVRTSAAQAVLLKRLGYDGFGASGYPTEESLHAFKQEGLKVFNTYLMLSSDSAKPGLDPKLKEFVSRLKGHDTALWIAIDGVTRDGVKLKPSTLEGDDVVVPALRELADLGKVSGIRIALYPHARFWLARLDDATRVTRKTERSDVGVTFNLCHWLKVEGDRDPKPVLKDALPNLFFVSINGADNGDTKTMDWSKLIQPLDTGSYNVGSLLKALRELGYRGPIGFQGYGIKGDSEEILRRTIEAWRRLASVASSSSATAASAGAPKPFGLLPTQRQLRWHEMEFYGFLHFTVNTFTDKEWGYGDELPAVFNPTDFDADQIVRTAKEAGMAGLILTAKHHDGFCLWPSQYTEHSVKNSPWRNGKGDVVKEISQACRRHGLRFGIYLSPWDRNHPDYARLEYLTYYRNQLRELLTNYGDVFTVWFDGANGGDGYYGGAKEKRNIDNRTYYDWENTRKIVRELMPMAVMFSDAGPDMRWVGNERGIAGDPCWATLNAANRYPGGTSDGLNCGERPGTDWIPAECDVSIRPGWFYHAKEDARVKTPAQLLDIYYQSVGRGADLNLNLPPDRRGQIHENDIASLREFRRILDATFAKDLARGAKLSASNTRGGAKQFAPKNLLDHKRDTYWSTDDNVTTPELVIELGKPTTFNVVSLREFLPLGQRIEAFALDQWKDGRWVEFAKGTSIGNRRLVRGDYITTDKVRLRITQAAVCPALSEIGLYAEPALAK